jgi:hypothetical protein
MNPQKILVILLAAWLIFVTTRAMYRDVKARDWNSLAIHSVHMTCIGLALAIAIPYFAG